MSSNAFDNLISKWSSVFSVPFALIKAVIRVESNFNPQAVNPKSSASGLMQLITGTWKWMGGAVGSVFDPDENIKRGSKYLKFNLDRHGGDPEAAIADYYAGTAHKDDSGRWYRNTKQGRDYSVNTYVKDVMSWYRKYSASSSPPQAASSSGETGSSGGGPGTDMILLLLAGFVGLLFIKRWVKK